MALFKKRTLRTMSPTARKVARLAGELVSVARRLKNLIPELQKLDADSKASDILGQDQVVAILKSQTKARAYHHAYLFFGASGTGKTSTARVLAMSLNCYSLNGDGEPCGKCPSCEAVIESRHWDVLEIDGARFRGIDDVKELAYRSYLAPMGNRKVYIIDECHMLTEPAWNGMLKLLEEPPPHLVIILCTTHFEKIPDTITSRCQLYPFEKLKPDLIKSKLERIASDIGITPDPKHIQFIVESSHGNMRTAENTLEQVCQINKEVTNDSDYSSPRGN